MLILPDQESVCCLSWLFRDGQRGALLACPACSSCWVNCPAHCPAICPANCPANCPTNCRTNCGASCWAASRARFPISPILAHLPGSSLPGFCPVLPVRRSPGGLNLPRALPAPPPPRLVRCWTRRGSGLFPGWETPGAARSNPHPRTYLSHRSRLSPLFLPHCSGAKTAPTSPARWG